MAVARDASGKLVLILQDDVIGEDLRRHAEGTDAAAGRRGDDRRAGGSPRRRATRSSRAPSCSPLDKTLQTYIVPVGTSAGIRPQTISTRRRARADAALRREARRLRPNLGRRGVPRQRQGLVHRTVPTSWSPGGRPASAPRTSSAIVNDPLVQQPFVRVLIWTIVFAALYGRALVRARALPRDHARQEGDALPARLPDDSRHPVRDPGLPLAARLGRAAERPVRRRQPDIPHQHSVALRRELGEGVVHHRQRLADACRTSSSSRWARSRRSPRS